ncbi:MAG: hypothetical protein ACJ8BW_00960 [Ktedonobacteraceae bacterium]
MLSPRPLNYNMAALSIMDLLTIRADHEPLNVFREVHFNVFSSGRYHYAFLA